jgi:hypothetical protein
VEHYADDSKGNDASDEPDPRDRTLEQKKNDSDTCLMVDFTDDIRPGDSVVTDNGSFVVESIDVATHSIKTDNGWTIPVASVTAVIEDDSNVPEDDGAWAVYSNEETNEGGLFRRTVYWIHDGGQWYSSESVDSYDSDRESIRFTRCTPTRDDADAFVRL